jgi:hypothetical protein
MGPWRAKIRSLLLCLARTGFNDVAFFAEKEFESESSGRSQKTLLTSRTPCPTAENKLLDRRARNAIGAVGIQEPSVPVRIEGTYRPSSSTGCDMANLGEFRGLEYLVA